MATRKEIPRSAIPAALEKALRYRLLNEPREAESICLDILAVDPDHKQALATRLLALTDQFEAEFAEALDRAKEVLASLSDDYDREYYAGIINERWAKAQLTRGIPPMTVIGWLREAMQCYERAEELGASDDPDAILRWNTCARLMDRLGRHEAHAAPVQSHHWSDDHGDEAPGR